ncbi:MAG: peptide chain release factor 2 [candidate division Zixibacteria bacterium RBG_16_53_22]|nr:MAG: peptide chain release factor 2 [candidate division Zixibacteria bacterium RBG_16_53_22]
MDRLRSEAADLEKETQGANFWADNQKAQAILKKLNTTRKTVADWEALQKEIEETSELLGLSQADGDTELRQEIGSHLGAIARKLDDFEFQSFLSNEEDAKDAILAIHPGAGGTESQDWASMLLRMYLRWAENHGFQTDMMDYQAGDEAGIKSATLEIKGPHAYGYLKSESGVHRLVRISPFDANKRRHTSFASVFIYPETDEDINIEIKPDDLKIDTFRASGAGGQHVNKTSSAVRITHIPTGIVVQCQTERSQHKNRESAVKVLRARLYQKALEEERAKMATIEASKKKIEWGSQIRSYVFQPYTMVKDHRTEYETSNVNAVMDGEIDNFIHAYLSHRE